ncbi:hypothetical protein IGI42_002499 [Enterococcus sp. AZ109]
MKIIVKLKTSGFIIHESSDKKVHAATLIRELEQCPAKIMVKT